MNSKTAIVIFANSAQKEGDSKSFHNSVELFTALNTQVVETVKKTQLPFYILDEKEQTGDSFGERFTNAIQTVLEKGYDKVITVGNDSPELQTKHLLTASQNLTKNKTVIGPSMDGGFYLLGITKEAFDKNTFLDLPWKTSKLFSSVLKVFHQKNIETFTLNTLHDIDILEDAKKVIHLHKKIKNSLRALLICLFEKSTFLFAFLVAFYKDKKHTNYFNKGSPIQIQFL